MKKNAVLVVIILIISTLIPFSSFAADDIQIKPYVLSIEDAYQKALNTSIDLNKNDKNIYYLTKPFGATEVLHNRSQFNMENEFLRLYDKLKSGKFLQSFEQGELVMYYSVFKDSEVFRDKSLSPAIYPEEFPNCDVWVSMMQMKINGELMRRGILAQVRQLYDNLLYMDDNISISEEALNIAEKSAEIAEINYKNGKISEIEKEQIQGNFKTKRLELDKQKRSRENLERNLKNITGIDISDNIQIEPYKISKKDLTIPSYESCLNKAFLNRNEIAVAKMNLLATQIQLKNIENYIFYMPNIEDFQLTKQELLLRIDELKEQIKSQEHLVQISINDEYTQAAYNRKNLDIAEKNYNASQDKYNQAQLEYNQGKLSLNTLNNVKIAYEADKAIYDKAVRDLAYQIGKLKDAYRV